MEITMSERFYVAVSTWELTEKLAKNDKRWGAFNGSFVNEFIGIADLCERIHKGNAFTSWHNPQYRDSDNWELSQFLAVDMDQGTSQSSIEGMRKNEFILGFATFIYTTPSHTDEEPRCRPVFLLDRPIVNPIAYNRASKFLQELLGGDPASTDASRFFYGNANATFDFPLGILPVDYLYTLYQRHKQQGMSQQSQSQPNHRSNHSTNQHGSQAMRGRREGVEKMLSMIDPWGIEYLDWVACIGAIRHELGEEGLPLAVSWAQGKKGEVERTWRSMRKETGNLATFGKLCHLAGVTKS
jgi:hypothetical protein